MELFHVLSLLVVLSAGFSYVNYRLLKLPNAIGLMLVSLGFSLILLVAGRWIPAFYTTLTNALKGLDFSAFLLQGMLSFMLFAGAIHIRYEDLKRERISVFLFSTLSVLISTLLVGALTFYLMNALGYPVQWLHALLFGALISPTDPIAVLSILKKAGIAPSLETKIAGESLFNDGVAVVVFVTILQMAQPGAHISAGSVALLFLEEAVGGLILGGVTGYFVFRLLKSIDNYQVEVLLTLALVMGAYSMAQAIHVSGPLAMVAAGILIGNVGKSYGMSDITAEYVDKFWELIDEILNAVLFVLIGLELLVVQFEAPVLIAGLMLIPLVLMVRYISVWLPSILMIKHEKLSRNTLSILTWGGLRGGISIALALSIPAEYAREYWVMITYIIVCFSILVQGLTIGPLTQRLMKKP